MQDKCHLGSNIHKAIRNLFPGLGAELGDTQVSGTGEQMYQESCD